METYYGYVDTKDEALDQLERMTSEIWSLSSRLHQLERDRRRLERYLGLPVDNNE
jgi:predicted nuclease with TOPRIM domain